MLHVHTSVPIPVFNAAIGVADDNLAGGSLAQ